MEHMKKYLVLYTIYIPENTKKNCRLGFKQLAFHLWVQPKATMIKALSLQQKTKINNHSPQSSLWEPYIYIYWDSLHSLVIHYDTKDMKKTRTDLKMPTKILHTHTHTHTQQCPGLSTAQVHHLAWGALRVMACPALTTQLGSAACIATPLTSSLPTATWPPPRPFLVCLQVERVSRVGLWRWRKYWSLG